jgi:hypothetical protein
MAINQFESVTVSTTAIGITATLTDNQENFALITCEGATVRFRLDGTAPTASVGHELLPGDVLGLNGSELTAFLAIRRDGSDATLRVSVGVR